jgi:predicted dehydrogenase
MLGHGPEVWHPDPEFFYKKGGGPMFDMGPYYLTALVSLIGPVDIVTGLNRITFPERTVKSQKKYGEKIKVEVPTHVIGVMKFVNGAIGNITTSFDVWGSNFPPIEIYGTKGTLRLPDPNGFGGIITLFQSGSSNWEEVPLSHGYTGSCRSIGLADMAKAIETGREHRASGYLAFHVLDIMQSFHEANKQQRHIKLVSTCNRPDPLPTGLEKGELD